MSGAERKGPIPYQLMWDLCCNEADRRERNQETWGPDQRQEAERIAFLRMGEMVRLWELHERDFTRIAMKNRRD